MKFIEKVTNTKEFIKKAKNLHNDFYDYSQVEYFKSNIKIKIKCPIHGLFKQTPNSHLNKRGCPKCGNIRTVLSQKYTKEEFIAKARIVHKDKYDYSLVEYKGYRIKVKIKCPRHGYYWQGPSDHLNCDCGCECCSRELRSHNSRYSTEKFVELANKVHNNFYDYSLVNYVKSNIKVKIICPKHGIFKQTPNNHIMKMKCMKCSIEDNADKKRLTIQEVLNGFIKIHGDKYDYSEAVYKNGDEKVKIVCRRHGPFFQTPSAHKSGRGCPFCHESRGERKIALFLASHNIVFKREKEFKKCRYKGLLYFDFYVPKLNACIEYDGKQHFEACDFFGGKKEFDRIKISDSIKTEFCKNNNIKLVRISYRTKDPEIVSILEKEIIELYNS
jgi:hypothetical protein